MRSHCNLLLRRDQFAILLLATARRWAVPLLIVLAMVGAAVAWQIAEVRDTESTVLSWQEVAEKAEKVHQQARAIQTEAKRLLAEVQAIEALGRGWSPTWLLRAIVQAIEAAEGRVAVVTLEVTESNGGNAQAKQTPRKKSNQRIRKLTLRGIAADSRALAAFADALTRADGIREVVVDQVTATDAGTEFVLTGHL